MNDKLAAAAKARAENREKRKTRGDGLTDAQRAKVTERIEQVPGRFRELYSRVVLAKSASRSAAIRAKCAECVGFELATTAIRECSDATCPLWQLRPYQTSDDDASDEKEGSDE